MPAWLRGAAVYMTVLLAAGALVVARPRHAVGLRAGAAVPAMAPLAPSVPRPLPAGPPPWLATPVSPPSGRSLSFGLRAAVLAACGRDAQAAALLSRGRAGPRAG